MESIKYIAIGRREMMKNYIGGAAAKSLFTLSIVWIITLLISGFFPKIRSNKKQRMKRKDLTSKFTCM